MTTVLPPLDPPRTLADLLADLGGISPQRVLLSPPPGLATEEDLLDADGREHRLCELVDGALVEKAMGFSESCLAAAMIAFLRAFVIPHNRGLVSGADGTIRLFPGLVRIPDAAFVSWDRIPDRRMPAEPIPDLSPNLAIEILSEHNTPREMARKRREYFNADVELVWQIDPRTRTVAVYTAPEQAILLDETQTLDGGLVLPGFSLSLAELFAELDRQGAVTLP